MMPSAYVQCVRLFHAQLRCPQMRQAGMPPAHGRLRHYVRSRPARSITLRPLRSEGRRSQEQKQSTNCDEESRQDFACHVLFSSIKILVRRPDLLLFLFALLLSHFFKPLERVFYFLIIRSEIFRVFFVFFIILVVFAVVISFIRLPA